MTDALRRRFSEHRGRDQLQYAGDVKTLPQTLSESCVSFDLQRTAWVGSEGNLCEHATNKRCGGRPTMSRALGISRGRGGPRLHSVGSALPRLEAGRPASPACADRCEIRPGTARGSDPSKVMRSTTSPAPASAGSPMLSTMSGARVPDASSQSTESPVRMASHQGSDEDRSKSQIPV